MSQSFDLESEIETFQDSISCSIREIAASIESSKLCLSKISHLTENDCDEVSKKLESMLTELTEMYELVSY